MSSRFLTWYTCGVLSFAFLTMLFISVTPDAKLFFGSLQAILWGAALSFALLGVVLDWLPDEHWSHRSTAVRCCLSVAAVVSSLLVIASVG